MNTIYIGIGSNIEPEENIATCFELLKEQWPDIIFSSVYKTAPRELEEQSAFLNAVAKIQTEQTPEDIHEYLKSIEEKLGKAPPVRFGPRTIDLDLLLFNEDIIELDTLMVPHPRMHERRFVLEPLCELIDVQNMHPVLNETWEELLKNVDNQGCERYKEK